MPTIHEDYLTAYYDEEAGELVIKNESSDYTAYDVSIDVGGVSFEKHEGIGVGPGYDEEITLFPNNTFSVPFERTQRGPSESYVVELTYYDEEGDEHTDSFDVHL